ncbi:MAG: molybdenum cofactor guanylyltransferase [Anaeromicrobium sp.]|jgi:molybdopterin-guanine dinucleotide biosynthesis protein A|uniref:molybdenum cofactor guanylyltransferase n=1 Tax=Anaeromicrobium sp. TaxID=1929132 RepID=UPI0025E15D1F|nr:molybdenum cofactor guanylyltransferase [Anaeromicrobium sp.]MCT4593295.1 molybdenum cofactor guanylyltransferase [Anaeromicrobium sp.]
MIKKGAIILAGGQSRRMNYEDKAFLKIGKDTFMEKILKETCDYKERIIISNDPHKYRALNAFVCSDILESKGPLAGIHAGLKNATYEKNLIVACDMPNLNRDFLNFLGNIQGDYDVIVPVIGTYEQPLCAIYKKSIISTIEECIKNEIYKVKELYKHVSVGYIQIPEKYENIFMNVNTPSEYKCLLRRTKK